MKKYQLSAADPRIVMDDVGNTVARCIWKNTARRICRLLNQHGPR